MTVFYLAESRPAEDLQDDAKIVALHPRVFNELPDKKARTAILEDYYTESELRADEHVFFDDQLAWFSGLDALLKNHLPVCQRDDLSLATAHYNRIKYFIDFLIIRARIVRYFMERAQPSRLIYVREAEPVRPETPASFYNFSRHDRWSFQAFFALHARCFPGVPFDTLAPTASGSPAPERHAESAVSHLAARGRTLVKDGVNFFRYQKWRGFFRGGERPGFLFLDSGNAAIDEVQRDFIRKGAHLYFNNHERTVDRSALHEAFLDRPNQLQESRDAAELEPFRKALETFLGSPLNSWADHYSPLPLAALAEPCWKNFFLEILPQTLRQYGQARDFLRSRKIRAVIARSSSGMTYAAPLLAARSLKVPRICYQHSIGPIDMPGWIHAELGYFDINFAQAKVSADHFKAWAQSRYPDCEVLESSDYLRGIARRAVGRRSASGKRVFYVPTKLAHGCVHFNIPLYPMSWYYRHQQALLTAFANHMSHRFVYKHVDGQPWADQSIIPWIQKSAFSNIEVKKGNFTAFLKEAERVIFDYPSTGFFETLAAGIPVLALFHESFTIWPAMLKTYHPCLQPFSSSEEAIRKIDVFLKSDGAGYTPNLELTPFDSVEYLLKKSCPLSKSHSPMQPYGTQ